MSFQDWVPAIVSSVTASAVLAGGGFLFKGAIENGIKHAFDAKLESLKADFRRDEEKLRAEIRRRDDELATLRGGALSALAARHGELARRRLDAVEMVWGAVDRLKPYASLAAMTQSLKLSKFLDAAAEGTGEAKKIQQFAETMLTVSKIGKGAPMPALPHQARLYVPALVWALFSAYQQVTMYPYAVLSLASVGGGSEMMANPSLILGVAKTALPHRAAEIDGQGTHVIASLVTELEAKLLNALAAVLQDSEFEGAAVTQAAEIMARVTAATAAATAAQSDATAALN